MFVKKLNVNLMKLFKTDNVFHVDLIKRQIHNKLNVNKYNVQLNKPNII